MHIGGGAFVSRYTALALIIRKGKKALSYVKVQNTTMDYLEYFKNYIHLYVCVFVYALQ